LPRLYPLPDGLHFTPAMSARALMDDRLKVVERPMPYQERTGQSKLSVCGDGARFLRTILEMTLVWRPARIFVSGAVVCLLVTLLLAMHPAELWLREGHLEEHMIYRLLLSSLLGMLAMAQASAYYISQRLHDLAASRDDPDTLTGSFIHWIFSLRGVVVATLVAAPLLGWLIGPGLWTCLTQRQVFIHWSRVVLAGLIAFSVCQLAVTSVLINLIRLHAERLRFAHQYENAAHVTTPLDTPSAATPARATKDTEPADLVLT
jgi:hypothetical protein